MRHWFLLIIGIFVSERKIKYFCYRFDKAKYQTFIVEFKTDVPMVYNSGLLQ